MDFTNLLPLKEKTEIYCTATVAGPGHARFEGDPTRVAPHHFHHDHAVVRLGGRVQPVDRFGRDRERGIEAERVVGAVHVVVDGLGHTDQMDPRVVELGRDSQGVLAADRDQDVDAPSRQLLTDPGFAPRLLIGVRPRGAEYRSAARKDPGDLFQVQLLDLRLEDPAPAVPKTENGAAVGLQGAMDDRADDRVQAGAVAPAGQHADPHRRTSESIESNLCRWVS